jgi:hypothetical protein
MILKNLNDINKADLQEIVNSGRLEDQTTEYKGELWGASDEGKFEFYKDITAFANAEGGDLIVGITRDEKKYPKELKGLEGSPDNEISRLNKMIQNGIEPNIIPAPKIIPISLNDEKFAIIIRVYQSITAPNRIAFKGSNKFYIRINNDSVEMSITQLRNAFALSESLVERIQKFRMERLQKLVSGETPIPMGEDDNHRRGKLMLHVIPFQSFLSLSTIDINNEAINSIIKSKFQPLNSEASNIRYNLEGVLKYVERREGEAYSYAQLFRNGVIEATEQGVIFGNKFELNWWKAGVVEKTVYGYINLLNELNFAPPFLVFLLLHGVRNSIIQLSYFTEPTPLNTDTLLIPEVVVDKFVSSQSELENILKPIFDTLWNAYGYQAPPNNSEVK